MSRVGKMPIKLTAGVEVKVDGRLVKVKGPKGEIQRELPEGVEIVREDDILRVKRLSDELHDRAMHGLARTLVGNMVDGVTKGFQKSLDLTGVGYRAAKQGTKLVLTVGYSHPVEIEPEPGLEIEVPTPNKIIVKGIDRERVGVFAAAIRAVREPEPYKGKGIRYEGEVVRHKVGKTGVKGGKK